MFFFGAKKEHKQTHLVVSFEALHVRACFVSMQSGEKPYITAQYIEKMRNQSEEVVKKTLDSVLQILFTKQPQVVTSVVCVLGKPWYVSYTNNFLQEENTPFLFRESHIKQILQDHISHSQREAIDFFQTEEQNIKLLEKNILHIGLNGYEVQTLKRDRIRKAEVTSYVSFAEKNILSMIENEIHRHVKKDVSFHSSSFVQTVVARDIFEYLDNLTLVSVDAKHTEINIISDGAITHGTFFEIGDEIFDLNARTAEIDPATLHSELRALAKGVLHHGTSPKLQTIISASQDEWRRYFFETLQKISREISIPQDVVVVSNKDSFFWIQKAIQDSRNKHLTTSETNLHAILINTEALYGFVGSKISEPDSKLMMYTAFTTLKVKN